MQQFIVKYKLLGGLWLIMFCCTVYMYVFFVTHVLLILADVALTQLALFATLPLP